MSIQPNESNDEPAKKLLPSLTLYIILPLCDRELESHPPAKVVREEPISTHVQRGPKEDQDMNLGLDKVHS